MNFLSELKICRHYYDQERKGPVMVDIHPTLACQNRCYFCISANPHITGVEHENFSRGKSIDWEDLKRTIGELKSLGVKSVQLTGGGEPTLYPHFSDLLEELEPMRVGLITNGVVLGEYAKEVVDHCNWVRVSLDAVGGEMYRQIKGVDNYHMVVDGIGKVCAARRELKSPRFGIGYVLTNESIRGIVDVAMEFSQTCVDYIQFRDVVERGRTFDNAYRTRINQKVEEAREVSSSEIIYTSHKDETVDDSARAKKMPLCEATDYVAVIGADSNIYGCCHLEYQDFASYGSIKERSFTDIWMNRPRVNISEALCWNCRFTKVNKILDGLRNIEDGDFI